MSLRAQKYRTGTVCVSVCLCLYVYHEKWALERGRNKQYILNILVYFFKYNLLRTGTVLYGKNDPVSHVLILFVLYSTVQVHVRLDNKFTLFVQMYLHCIYVLCWCTYVRTYAVLINFFGFWKISIIFFKVLVYIRTYWQSTPFWIVDGFNQIDFGLFLTPFLICHNFVDILDFQKKNITVPCGNGTGIKLDCRAILMTLEFCM